MVFSSIIFTFCFLPVVLVLYTIARRLFDGTLRIRVCNAILLLSSLFFYAYGEPQFVLVMLASILLNYLMALAIARQDLPTRRGRISMAQPLRSMDAPRGRGRRAILVLDIFLNLALLFVYKYLDFSITIFNDLSGAQIALRGIALPIGISFFTFQAMSYVIDVYRGDTPVQRNPFRLALYIAFFPQLIAGPIVRYNTIAAQIGEDREITWDRFGYGARRFLAGFFLKVVIANNLALVAEQTFAVVDFGGENHSILFYWLGAVAYALQILFDFSGYSEMAIGLGAMFGFTFEENFDHPYMAGSITDFWRRWHISLSRWFRDYVYIPLGGSRCDAARHIRNIWVVWLLTGLWHGANYTFLLWGMGYCVLLILEKYLVHPERRGRVFRAVYRVFTLLCVLCLWIMFNSASVGQGLHYIAAMAGWNSHEIGWQAAENVRILREYGVYYVLGIVFCFPVRKGLSYLAHTGVQTPEANRQRMYVCAGLACTVLTAGFLWAVSFLILGAHNPFIYFNF